MEHDTEEFHRASTEQLALKQQYIELLEAMGVPVTEELTHNQGRRRLLARARGELEEQSFDSYPAPLVAAATLVDALKTRLAAYDEYIGNKAQVAALARLYQVRAPLNSLLLCGIHCVCLTVSPAAHAGCLCFDALYDEWAGGAEWWGRGERGHAGDKPVIPHGDGHVHGDREGRLLRVYQPAGDAGAA